MASDRRAYVKIPDAILREPWDDATLADLVRLQAFLNTRWARDHLTAEQAGKAFLGPQEIMLITHTSNATRARKRLLALRERTAGVTLAVAEATRGRSKGVIIDWPKFPKEQGYFDRDSPRLGGNLGVTPPLPQTQPHTQKKEEKKEPAPDGALSLFPVGNGKPKPEKRARKTAFPEPFPLDLRAKLETWAVGRGFSPPQVVGALESVRDWAVSNDKRKADWVATVQGGMRAGWALPKPGASETDAERYARMAREMEEEERASR